MGKGFAMRWCREHPVMIGSRDAARAADTAATYQKEAQAAHAVSNIKPITGASNAEVAAASDILILSIPYGNIDAICSEVLPQIGDECIVVSPIVPMERTKIGFEFVPFRDATKTAHESVASHMRDEKAAARLVSAFHVISEKKLANLEIKLDYDIFVCGDDEQATGEICSFISEIEGLRPILLGSGRLAYMAEIATPLLLNAAKQNKLKNPGIKLV